jgi:hypothetical protein
VIEMIQVRLGPVVIGLLAGESASRPRSGLSLVIVMPSLVAATFTPRVSGQSRDPDSWLPGMSGV